MISIERRLKQPRWLSYAVPFLSVALAFGIIAFYDIPLWGLTFQIAGSAMNSDALLRIGSIISAPHWGLWLGFAMVIVFSLVALRGMTTYTKIINGMLILPAIGSVLMIICMA